jgi:hypothetical protein
MKRSPIERAEWHSDDPLRLAYALRGHGFDCDIPQKGETMRLVRWEDGTAIVAPDDGGPLKVASPNLLTVLALLNDCSHCSEDR